MRGIVSVTARSDEGHMSADFYSQLDSTLNRSVAPKELIARDRRAIIRAGIDSEATLLRAASSTTASVRTLAVVGWLLPRWPSATGRRPYFDAVRTLLAHPSPVVRAEAAVAMSLFPMKDAPSALVSLLEDGSDDVRIRAIGSLGVHGDVKTLPALIRLLSDRRESVGIRAGVADALSGFDADKVQAALSAALSDSSPQVRASAAHSIGELHVSSASALLKKLTGSTESRIVRDAALAALSRLRRDGR